MTQIVGTTPVITLAPARWRWNAWNTITGITWERDEWHDWCVRNLVRDDGQLPVLSDAEWWFYYTAYRQGRDAADLRDTQRDALV